MSLLDDLKSLYAAEARHAARWPEDVPGVHVVISGSNTAWHASLDLTLAEFDAFTEFLENRR